MEFDKKYQQSVILMMLYNYEFMVRCRGALEPEYFDTSRSVISELILNYYDRYRNVPTERALTDIFEEKISTTKYQKYEKIIRKVFDSIWEEKYPKDADYIEEKLIDFAKTQSYLTMAKAIPGFVEVGQYTEIERMNNKIAQIGMNNAVVIRSSEAVKDESLQLNNAIVDAIPTGIPGLDASEVLEGGLGRKELGIILAPPNVGKTMLLNHLGVTACMAGKRVYHLTLEMSADQSWRRYISSIASVSTRMILTKMKSVREQVQEFFQQYGGELIIDERPTKKFSPKDLDMELDKMSRAGEMPDLILIDYGDIMKSDSNYGAKHENESEIYIDLRALCSKYNTRMWVPSQGSRDSTEKKTIEGQDIKGSFDKVATADVIVSINMTKEEYQDGIARIYVPKNRRGLKNITIEIDTKYEHSRFVSEIIVEANQLGKPKTSPEEAVKRKKRKRKRVSKTG